MVDAHARTADRTLVERRVVWLAFAVVPALVVVGVAMLVVPEILAESDTAMVGQWLGAAVGVATFLLLIALPQPFFGLSASPIWNRNPARCARDVTARWARRWSQRRCGPLLRRAPPDRCPGTGWSGVWPPLVIASAAVRS